MTEYATISQANLNYIERSLGTIDDRLDDMRGELDTLGSNLGTVNENVRIVHSEVGDLHSLVDVLAESFLEFMKQQKKIAAKANAQQELILTRQELEKRFGHHDIVRRTTTGILQATDLGLVKKSTVANATEELMLSTPGYWLAPSLVALAAWINDQPELAEKAALEAIARDNEKTSLFFCLICRRAERKNTSLKWLQRYLANQDERNLDRKTIIVLDAFASGLLGADSEGVVSQQLGQWIDKLAETPGFVEQQKSQWSAAIEQKRRPLADKAFPYLRKYSKTWPALQYIMEGALLHADILRYFSDIFSQEISTATLKAQLDEILDHLVTDYDNEELPLRKKEKYNEFVIEFEGDVNRANLSMTEEESAFEAHKDFMQLLTDAAMKPESTNSSPSTQKFAIALTKDWIMEAYRNVTAQNRMLIPAAIEINVDTFNGATTDGQNEAQLLAGFNALVQKEKEAELAQYQLSGFTRFCLWGGAALGLLGVLMLFVSQVFLGLIAIIGGGGLVINYISKKNKAEEQQAAVEQQFQEKLTNGSQIIRAVLAEAVDFRAEFAKRDSASQQVLDFLEQISPSQYIAKLSGSNRRIAVNN